MSKPLKTVHLILIAFIVAGTLFAIDSHYKAVANAEKRALEILDTCRGSLVYKVIADGTIVKIEGNCREGVMGLQELRKGRNDT